MMMRRWKITQRGARDMTRVRTIFIDAFSSASAENDPSVVRGDWVSTRVEDMGEAAKSRKTKKIAGKTLSRLCRGLGSMMEAGVSLEDALRFYVDGASDPEMGGVLRFVQARLVAGESVREAFAASGRFDPVFLGMVRAGSEAGTLGRALKAVAHRVEITEKFRARLTKALVMPIGVICFLLIVFVAAQMTLIPQVEKMLKDVGQSPDAVSKIIFSFAAATRMAWPFVATGLLGMAGIIIFRRRTREQMIAYVGKIWPVVQRLVGGFRQMLFLGVLSMLTRNGISIEDALTVCGQTLTGSSFATALGRVRRLYGAGLPLSQALSKEGHWDPVLCHMVGVGENSGTLEEQLVLLVQLYEEQTEEAMDAFVQMVSLGTISAAVFLIGFVFVGTYLPIVLMGPRMMQSGI